jgi:photosystem II stability/assembly factor-like uncharacterized protein
MKKLSLIAAVIITACSANPEKPAVTEVIAEPWIDPSFQSFDVNTSIRALSVTDDDHIYYAGANGAFGFSQDGGKTWNHDSIEVAGSYPEFRAIAVTGEAIHLLSVGSPAYLLRSTDLGKNWELVYSEEGELVFYDAMQFWDNQEGIAMGDPTDGCISVIVTRDGGQSWEKIGCEELPAIKEGEAAFAASNTNIALVKDHAWIGTGGGAARIYHSKDRGNTWEIYDTPLIQGGAMTGIFSVDFYDESTGIIFGGNWEAKSNAVANAAITTDGGQSWQLISEARGPGYRSCIQFVPGGGGKSVIAVGIPGVAYSRDMGSHWQLLSDEDFYTIRFTPDGSAAWLAGNGKIAKMEID